jgi:hypothetical protein
MVTSKKSIFVNKIYFSFSIVAQILKNIIENEQELILETDSDEAVLSDSESELHEHTAVVEITFCQDHNTHGILVVSVLSLELSLDC